MNNKLIPVSQQQHSIVPTVDEALRLGEVFAKSGYFSDARSGAQAVVKIIAGAELGLPPMASMTGIDIITSFDGKSYTPRLRLSAQMVASLIRKSGRYDYHVVSHTEEICRIQGFRIEKNGERTSLGESVFTIQDAARAGLLERVGKDGKRYPTNYKRYPKNMLFHRAIYNLARYYTPEIFSGMTIVTDADEDAPQDDVPQAPAPAPEPHYTVADIYDDTPQEEQEIPEPDENEPDPNCVERLKKMKVWIKTHLESGVIPETAPDDLVFQMGLEQIDEIQTPAQFATANEILVGMIQEEK